MPTPALPGAFSAETPLFQVLADPRGHALFSRVLPQLVSAAILHTLHGYPVALVINTEPSLADHPEVREQLLGEVLSLQGSALPPARVPEVFHTPSATYEPESVARGSAAVHVGEGATVYGRIELSFAGPAHGNPFVDVEIAAEFSGPAGTGTVTVPGFYLGDGNYRIRLLPEVAGTYHFTTRSNARSLAGISGSVAVAPAIPGDHGPVRVAERFHFAHADGTAYRPIGTTSYVWTHQEEALQELTLRTLEESPFNKMRMCLFPKAYLFNENEPELYPFEGSPEHGFDLQRPSAPYWAHLERRLNELAALGIQADLILFHAYDRWGFATMDPVADDRYVRYAVARLASFANVWWSLANEFDLLFAKTEADWERFAAIIAQDDPVGHLTSIHNCREVYDQNRPWITHVSIQRLDNYKTAEMTTAWRENWLKPIVIDECAYEGNIDQGWGNITGEEMTRRFWEGALRGGYVGHGETYRHAEDILWWAKGGELHGTSAPRIAFLSEVMAAAPGGFLEPCPLDWDVARAGVENSYLLYYFGFNQPTYRRFLLDPAIEWELEILDTWNMTTTRLPGTYSGRFQIELPGRPYIAVRLIAVAG